VDSCPPATSVVNSSRVTSERFLSGNPPDQYTMMTWPRRGKHGEAVRDGHDAQTGLPGRRGVIHGALIVRVQPEMSLVNVDLSAHEPFRVAFVILAVMLVLPAIEGLMLQRRAVARIRQRWSGRAGSSPRCSQLTAQARKVAACSPSRPATHNTQSWGSWGRTTG